MKKKEAPVYIQHWILIIFGVFIFLAARSRLEQIGHVGSVSAQPVQRACDTRFVAIHYPRISKRFGPDSMSKKMFREHMTMLKNAGYTVIGLEQVRDLYYSEKLLPEKSVLILLDGLRDTRINAVPVIRELGLRATVMLNVKAMKRNDRTFMSWHDLKKMQRENYWDFGIAINGSGDIQEQLDYLQDRIEDIRVCGVSMSIGFDGSGDFAKRGMLFFPRKNGDGYNNADANPSSLNVLRIEPQQDHHELTQLLSNVFYKAPSFEDKFVEDTMQITWTSTCGDIAVRNGRMELSAEPSQSSADVWLAGTYGWSDVDLNTKFRLISGKQFWAYVRYRNENNFVRLGCDGKRLFLQQRIAGAKVRNLKVFDFDSGFSQFRNLRLIVRGRYAIAYLDGMKLSTRPLRIDDSLISGKVGFAVWDPSSGIASCQITSASIRGLPCIALMNADWDRETSRCIAEHSDYLSYLCPGGPGSESSSEKGGMEDYRAFLISAAYSGHELTPTIELNESDIESNNPDILVNKLTGLMGKYRFNGLHLDCRDCQSNESLAVLAEVLTTLKRDLPESTLILSLPPQCYQTCEELLNAADVLVLPYEKLDCDFLDEVPRPFRLKTLLRVETDEPQVFVGNLVSSKESESANDSAGDVIHIVQNYELRGIALCERQIPPVF